MEILEADECYKFCSFTQRRSHDCEDTALPDPPLKNLLVKCLTFEENTRKPYNDNLCLFRALALHLHGNEKLEEEISKLFNLILAKTGGTDPTNFRGV